MWLVPKCGMPETFDHAPTDPCGATSLDQSTESHLETLHRAAIGPINADYYLPLLARFDAYGRASPSWNWAACVTTLNWMVFRGMWMPALLYAVAVAGAALGVQAAVVLAAPMTASLQWSLWAALVTLALLIPGFFGNVWLYGSYRKRLEKALTATPNLKQASLLLARWASSRPRLATISVANLVLAGLIVTLAWPSDLHMRMWPRVSGEVQDMAAPPLVAPSVPVGASASPSHPTPDTAATASRQGQPHPAEPPASASKPASGNTGPVSSSQDAQAQSKRPTDPLSQPLGPAARAAAVQNAAIATHSRAARFRPEPTSTAKPQPEPKTQARSPVAAPGKLAPAAGRYLVNVGLFAQQDNARRAHERHASNAQWRTYPRTGRAIHHAGTGRCGSRTRA